MPDGGSRCYSGGYLDYLEFVTGARPIYPDQVYRREFLDGLSIADIAKKYDWSLFDTAKLMLEQALKAHRRRQEVQLEKESHWWYRLWFWFFQNY